MDHESTSEQIQQEIADLFKQIRNLKHNMLPDTIDMWLEKKSSEDGFSIGQSVVHINWKEGSTPGKIVRFVRPMSEEPFYKVVVEIPGVQSEIYMDPKHVRSAVPLNIESQ